MFPHDSVAGWYKCHEHCRDPRLSDTRHPWSLRRQDFSGVHQPGGRGVLDSVPPCGAETIAPGRCPQVSLKKKTLCCLHGPHRPAGPPRLDSCPLCLQFSACSCGLVLEPEFAGKADTGNKRAGAVHRWETPFECGLAWDCGSFYKRNTSALEAGCHGEILNC